MYCISMLNRDTVAPDCMWNGRICRCELNLCKHRCTGKIASFDQSLATSNKMSYWKWAMENSPFIDGLPIKMMIITWGWHFQFIGPTHGISNSAHQYFFKSNTVFKKGIHSSDRWWLGVLNILEWVYSEISWNYRAMDYTITYVH